jgi:hypothetical protein
LFLREVCGGCVVKLFLGFRKLGGEGFLLNRTRFRHRNEGTTLPLEIPIFLYLRENVGRRSVVKIRWSPAHALLL